MASATRWGDALIGRGALALGRGHGLHPEGEPSPHPFRRCDLNCARVDQRQAVHGEHGLAMQVGPSAHERHGLGVGVVGRGRPACELVDAVPAPASRACAAMIIPFPSAAMSYMSSKCAMSNLNAFVKLLAAFG